MAKTHRNLGRNPNANKPIDIITRVEDHHCHAAQHNQRATFYQEDGDRLVRRRTEDFMCSLLRNTEANADRDCHAKV